MANVGASARGRSLIASDPVSECRIPTLSTGKGAATFSGAGVGGHRRCPRCWRRSNRAWMQLGDDGRLGAIAQPGQKSQGQAAQAAQAEDR